MYYTHVSYNWGLYVQASSDWCCECEEKMILLPLYSDVGSARVTHQYQASHSPSSCKKYKRPAQFPRSTSCTSASFARLTMIQLPIVEDDPLGQLLVDTPPALVVFCIPVTLTYISFYLLVKGWALTSRLLVLPTLVLFYVGANVAPVRCRAVQAGLNFGGKQIDQNIRFIKIESIGVLEYLIFRDRML